MRQSMEPLLFSYGVDLVFTGATRSPSAAPHLLSADKADRNWLLTSSNPDRQAL